MLVRGLSAVVREPLLWFLVAGAVLFTVDALRAPDDPAHIEVTAADQAHLADMWFTQARRPPTPEEMDMLIEQRIREEVLVREALRLGLDQDDVIIRRRLVQKLEFLAGDLATAVDPDAAELSEFYAANAARYAEPRRLSFAHVYFSPDRRDDAPGDARAQLAAGLGEDSWRASGDPFMLRRNYVALSERQVGDLFGREFAAALFALQADPSEPGWQGPIKSGYGWHLVRIDAVRDAFQPDLADVRERVLEDWRSERRREANNSWYQALREGYEIEVQPREATQE